jgi:hypothetical protein
VGNGTPDGIARQDLAAAVERIQQSGILDKKPNQARLFRYLAQRLLEGAAEPAKEYVLGVEVLDRGENFDPKTDSIVRVEIRKLRQTLEDYYESGPGRGEAILLKIPRGAYTLEAMLRSAPQSAAAGTPHRMPRRMLAGATLLTILAATAVWVLLRREPAGTEFQPRPPEPAASPGSTVRILAGNTREGFTDSAGRTWERDRYFEGGLAIYQPDPPVHNVHEPRLFQYHREGQFVYRIPLQPGLYELRLYFAEFHYGQGSSAGGGEVSRLFRIMLNGKVAYEPLDVVAEAPGRAVAMRKVFLNVTPAADGKLHIGFEPLRPDKPFVNAIEIVPGVKDRMLPIRMVAAAAPALDEAGRLWEPDSFFVGGRREPRSRSIQGAPAESLFRSERYGHFTYHLHAVRGHRYRLNLWMAEQYFGFPGVPPAAHRQFDVWANGATLLRNFDPMREAGGPGRAVRKSFGGLRTDAYGAIRLSFVPVRNYAMINALELIDEGPE